MPSIRALGDRFPTHAFGIDEQSRFVGFLVSGERESNYIAIEIDKLETSMVRFLRGLVNDL